MKYTSIALLMTLSVVGLQANAEEAEPQVAVAESPASAKTLTGTEHVRQLTNDKEVLDQDNFDSALRAAGIDKAELGSQSKIIVTDRDSGKKTEMPATADSWRTAREGALNGTYSRVRFEVARS